MTLGRVGIWTGNLDFVPTQKAKELVTELDELGWAAVWMPEVAGREPFVHAALLLSASPRITLATGIASIYNRDAAAAVAAQHTLAEAFGVDRFLLGLGVSHRGIVEGYRGHTYGPPVKTMSAYLDAMAAKEMRAVGPSERPTKVISALGPRMLELAREKTDGALTYLVTPEHTARAREALGDGKLLCVEQGVVLNTDSQAARATARMALSIYLPSENYGRNFKRMGYTDDDIGDGGSSRIVDALIAWGGIEAIKRRIDDHFAAGADHVCIQAFSAAGLAPPLEERRALAPPVEEWRALAPALLA